MGEASNSSEQPKGIPGPEQCGKRCRGSKDFCPAGQKCRIIRDKCHMTCEPVVKCPKCCVQNGPRCRHRLCANRDICPVVKCPKCCVQNGPRCRHRFCADRDICPV